MELLKIHLRHITKKIKTEEEDNNMPLYQKPNQAIAEKAPTDDLNG